MKKLILAIAMTMICFGASAQFNLKWGIKAGLNYQSTNITSSLWKETISAKDRVGWHAGLQASWDLGLLSIDPELVFSRNSIKFNSAASEANNSVVYTHTLDVPVALGINILGPLKIQAGLNFNILSDSGVKKNQLNFDFSTKNQTIGYLLGLMVDLGHINISARYNGFFKNNESHVSLASAGIDTSDLIKMRVSSWQLSAGFYF